MLHPLACSSTQPELMPPWVPLAPCRDAGHCLQAGTAVTLLDPELSECKNWFCIHLSPQL